MERAISWKLEIFGNQIETFQFPQTLFNLEKNPTLSCRRWIFPTFIFFKLDFPTTSYYFSTIWKPILRINMCWTPYFPAEIHSWPWRSLFPLTLPLGGVRAYFNLWVIERSSSSLPFIFLVSSKKRYFLSNLELKINNCHLGQQQTISNIEKLSFEKYSKKSRKILKNLKFL